MQGVGFRPAVYHLATASGLSGWIINRSGTVRIALEGAESDVARFMAVMPDALPPNARLDTVCLVERLPIDASQRCRDFSIRDSSSSDIVEVVIPPDLSLCRDCAREVLDKSDRRFGYPFLTCTNCGPRYTVVTSMPYDRERTTMADFPMCPACLAEYQDASDRRFHAETTACAVCGPSLQLEDENGTAIDDLNPILTARRIIRSGAILAIKGIGGYLLAANALDRTPLQRLRDRKCRPHKPFAVMAPDIEQLRQYCIVDPAAEKLLTSPAAPIVILDVRPDIVESGQLPLDLITPDSTTLGAMLPNSPLHRLLFDPTEEDPLPRFELLLMTSGNGRGEPTCIANDEAHDRLRTIADFFLSHNRRIKLRNDDSVCVIRHGQPQVWRRARGYAPAALHLPRPLKRCVLAMGAELKNTVAIAYAARAVMSPHIGDLDTPQAVSSLETVTETLSRFLHRTPDTLAVDLHPDMHSTRLGREIARRRGLPVVEIQHHHAHAVACMAENGVEEAIALTLDGTGLGHDGTIWGAELLDVNPAGCSRLGSFTAAPLPGGDAAVQQPLRQLVGRWWQAGVESIQTLGDQVGIDAIQAEGWVKQCSQSINCPLTHAAGRLFDAFAALLGLPPSRVTYEAQAAIRLETAARRFPGGALPRIPYTVNEQERFISIDWTPAFAELTDIRLLRREPDKWAMALHSAVAEAALIMIEYAVIRSPARTVALSGGVFMNRVLCELIVPAIEKRGIRPLIHRQSPPNDGCIALGQAVIAGRE